MDLRPSTALSLVFLLPALALSGCGGDGLFARAKKLEQKGKVYKAWETYQEVVARHPQHARAPEALFRAGLIAQHKFDDCYMAATFFDAVTNRYPQSDPWAKWSALQRSNCPDYFPLIPESVWVDVDSDTQGSNARIEIVCKPLGTSAFPSSSGKLVRTFFAGNKRFETRESIYKKNGTELIEMRDENDIAPQTLLRWPLKVGSRWSSKRDNKLFRYEIAATDKDVKVAAGTFKDCLLVRSSVEGEASSQLEYYAPGVGRVLKSIATKDGEKRITELQSYKIADPVFDPKEEK